MSLAAVLIGLGGLGLVLLDLRRFHYGVVAPTMLVLFGVLVVGAVVFRRRTAPRVLPRDSDRRVVVGLLGGLGLLLALGTGLRLHPSPYLHGGQDQGIYVNVGHHIARTGRLRPVDRLMAGSIPGVRPEDVRAAHRMKPIEPGSPLDGVREGRWIAGIHVEHGETGRLVPGFFHLLPVWFALAELDWGFGRSTWPLVPFWTASALALFALVRRLALGLAAREDECARRRASLAGLAAVLGLALHPLDLWISTFTVTENLARASLLGGAALALEADAAEREGSDGAVLMGVLAGLCLAAGAFTRGSMVAHAVALSAALMVAPTDSRRSRTALQWALVLGTALAIVQGIQHSWPYFFSAASNHFHVPRIHPHQGPATAWSLAGAGLVLGLDAALAPLRRAEVWRGRAAVLLRVGAAVGLVGALAAAAWHANDPASEWGPSQQVGTVLWRHGGPVALGLGLVGLGLGAWRGRPAALPWVALGAEILLATALKPGIRYEFYYARYLVADAIPVLVAAGALTWSAASIWADERRGPRGAALVRGALLLAWVAPPLRLLGAPVYWTRDLEGGPEQLAEMFEPVPEGALFFFDARAPGRWRGWLAVPAKLSFDLNVLVYPNNNFVERAIKAGTPVYFLSGGWEAEDRQYWPNPGQGPWRTEVVSRGTYRALRAEVVEGALPRRLTDWGGPWELHRIDRSIWRGTGAFTLYPGSSYASDRQGRLVSEELDMSWVEGARVELSFQPPSGDACETGEAVLRDGSRRVVLPALERDRADVMLWAMPGAATAIPHQLDVELRCADGRAIEWRRLSMRWNR